MLSNKRISIYLFVSLIIVGLFFINIGHSQAAFEANPILEVTSPNGGEVYTTGDEVKITWNQTNIDKITIGYKKCDSCLDWIVNNMEVDINSTNGSYTWTIPDNFDAADYKIYIIGYNTGVGSMSDTSDTNFTINSTGASASSSSEAITSPSDLPTEDAFKAIVKIKTFFSDRYYHLTQYSEGSGVIIDANGLILTNYHVVTMEQALVDSPRDTSYQVCIPVSISQEPDCSYNAKLVARDKDLDIAILKIENIAGLSNLSSFPYLELNQSDVTQVGDSVIALGYPAIGGETITITKGIISGKLNKYGLEWVKTDAVTSFGSSGGAAIDSAGKLIGITSQAHSDLIGSLGYIINVTSINSWVNQNINKIPQTSGLISKVIEFSNKQKALKNTNIFTNNYPPFSITKTTDWDFTYQDEDRLFIDKLSDDEGGHVELKLIKYPYITSLDNAIPEIKREFVDIGLLSMVSFVTDEEVTINGMRGKKVVISAIDKLMNMYIFPVKNYLIIVTYNYGKDDKDKKTVDRIINTFKVNTTNQAFNETKQFSNNYEPKFSLRTGNNWAVMTNNSMIVPVYIFHKNIRDAFVIVEVSKVMEDTKNFNNDEFLNYKKQQFTGLNKLASQLNLKGEITASDAHYKINNEADNVIMLESIAKNINNNEILLRELSYIIIVDDKYLEITLLVTNKNQNDFNLAKGEFKSMLGSFSLGSSPLDMDSPMVDNRLANRLKGKLLLQVEDRGRVWYVNPDDAKKYEVTFANALNLFERLSLGVTNNDLYKIPMDIDSVSNEVDTDGDGYSDKSEVEAGYNPDIKSNANGNDKISIDVNLSNRLKGKLLLQVEDRGRIWYVDFEGKRHEVTWKNLMSLFTRLSLGITNDDLDKIEVRN